MISVIIPIYNTGQYLLRMLKCLADQTERDFELLLINDGSTDRSGKICDQAAQDDPRIRVFHQENKGVSSARNFGIQKARGSYITFLDADDEIPKDYLEVLLRTCMEKDCEIAVCDVAVIRKGEEINRFSQESSILTQVQALNLLLTRKKINSGPYAKLFSRRVIEGIIFPGLRVYEDILFVKEAFCRATKIVSTDRTEYRYIQNENSAMSGLGEAPSKDIITATEELAEFIRSWDNLSEECMYTTLSHLMQYAQPLLKIEKRNEGQKSFIKQTRRLYRKNINSILACGAFPWKEKLIFTAFAFGSNYKCKKQ